MDHASAHTRGGRSARHERPPATARCKPASRHSRAAGPVGAGSSARARKKPSDFPVPPPRRVKCFSTSETGIALPKPRRAPAAREKAPRLGSLPRPGQFASSGSPRDSSAEQADDAILLQAQLAAMGIEISLDTVRERVRMAEQRLNSQGGLFPLQPPAPVFENANSRPGTARTRPDDTARRATSTSRAKRPATARARLEHSIAAKPMLSPVLSPDDDSDFELLDDEMRSPDEALEVMEVDFPAAASGVPEDDKDLNKPEVTTKKAEVSPISPTNNGVTQVEWAHGSLLSWGNPHMMDDATESTTCEPPKSTCEHQRFKLTMPATRGRTCQPAQTARPPARPSPRTLSRPVSARSMDSGSKASMVGLSPRTNVRTYMGIWAGPNTPGPGAYNVPEPTRKGATFSKDRKLAPTSTEVRMPVYVCGNLPPMTPSVRFVCRCSWSSHHPQPHTRSGDHETSGGRACMLCKRGELAHSFLRRGNTSKAEMFQGPSTRSSSPSISAA